MSVVIIDMKGSTELLEAAEEIARRHGLPFKFVSIEDRPGRARWNPLANGNHTVNKDRLLDVEEWSEPYYKGQCETALQNILRIMAATDTPANLRTVHDHLDPGTFRKWISEVLPEEDPERAALLNWMEAVSKDTKRLSAVRDMQSRLANMLGSVVGKVLVPGAGDAIDMITDLDRGAVIVFSLSAPSYPVEAQRLAAWATRELNVVAAYRMERLSAADRRPTLLLVDEFHSAAAATSQIAMGYQMFREARITCAVSCQSMLNLDSIEPADATQIKANARVTIANRDREGAEMIATRFGTAESWEPTMQTTQVGGVFNPTGEAATGTGSARRVDSYVIHPNILRRLPDHQVVVHVAGRLDDNGDPEMPKVCRVAPHHDHPLAEPMPKPEPISDKPATRIRVDWSQVQARVRRMLPTVAAAGGLLALIAIPILALRGTGAAPAAAAPIAADTSSGATPEGWSTAVMQAWASPASSARDEQLTTLVGVPLPAAPVTTAATPVATSVTRLDEQRWLLTYVVAAGDGTVSGWAITVDGQPWTLRSAPVPVPAPITPTLPAAQNITVDSAATDQLAPVLDDFMSAWGSGGAGDTERLATLTVAGRTLRPIGGLQLVDAEFKVSQANAGARAVDAAVTWDRYGAARYLITLQLDAAATWKVASIQPWPGAALRAPVPSTSPTSPTAGAAAPTTTAPVTQTDAPTTSSAPPTVTATDPATTVAAADPPPVPTEPTAPPAADTAPATDPAAAPLEGASP